MIHRNNINTGETISIMTALAKNMKTVEKYTSGDGKNDQHAGDYISNAEYEIKGERKRLNSVISKRIKTATPKLTSGNKSNSSSSNKGSSKNSTKKTKTQIDWLERRLTRMQSAIDLTASKLQNLFTVKAKSQNSLTPS